MARPVSIHARSTKRTLTQREEVGESDEECSDLDEKNMPGADKQYGFVGKKKASAGCRVVLACSLNASRMSSAASVNSPRNQP